MTQIVNQDLGLRSLYGMVIPCGNCSYCKSIAIKKSNQIIVDCWYSDDITFDLELDPKPECPYKELRDLCPNFEIQE